MAEVLDDGTVLWGAVKAISTISRRRRRQSRKKGCEEGGECEATQLGSPMTTSTSSSSSRSSKNGNLSVTHAKLTFRIFLPATLLQIFTTPSIAKRLRNKEVSACHDITPGLFEEPLKFKKNEKVPYHVLPSRIADLLIIPSYPVRYQSWTYHERAPVPTLMHLES